MGAVGGAGRGMHDSGGVFSTRTHPSVSSGGMTGSSICLDRLSQIPSGKKRRWTARWVSRVATRVVTEGVEGQGQEMWGEGLKLSHQPRLLGQGR